MMLLKWVIYFSMTKIFIAFSGVSMDINEEQNIPTTFKGLYSKEWSKVSAISKNYSKKFGNIPTRSKSTKRKKNQKCLRLPIMTNQKKIQEKASHWEGNNN